MKTLLIIIVLIIIVGCHSKHPVQHYPQFVHNPCTGKWAVKTGLVTLDYHGFSDEVVKVDGYLGKRVNLPHTFYLWYGQVKDDSVPGVQVPEEAQFADSLSAVLAYQTYIIHQNTETKERHIQDSINLREKTIADSISNCQHSYQ